MSLAIFDLDNTLLSGDSDYLWGCFLVEQGVVDAEHYERENQRFYDAYHDGSLNINEFLRFALQPLAKNSLETLQQWHRQFMQEKIEPLITSKSRDLLQQHREKGDYLLIITATNRFVTAPIAQHLGVDALLATDPEIQNGQYTGEVEGIPCFQEGKIHRLQAWLKTNPHSLEGSYFYSDSHNDLPLLKQVDYPVVVDADETLTAYAQQQGWPQISLKD
ncbi:MAG: HAD family hydrolase [Gammaproteobacteria bacterium]|nr:HAD family hydrolase [Gammaproteobacteria bacterium]